MIQKLFFYSSPQNFYPLAGKLWPVFACLATGLTVWGLWLGMFVAPADFQQGQGFVVVAGHFCYQADLYATGQLVIPDEDSAADLYDLTQELTEKAGLLVKVCLARICVTELAVLKKTLWRLLHSFEILLFLLNKGQSSRHS